MAVFLVFGAGVVVLAGAVVVLAARVNKLNAALAAAEKTLKAPKPPRVVEGREERFGLLWYPALTVDDEHKIVVSAVAGRPYCPKCLAPLALAPGPSGEWVCAVCSDRRAGTAADMQVVDGVVDQAVREFLARNPGHRLGAGVRPPKAA